MQQDDRAAREEGKGTESMRPVVYTFAMVVMPRAQVGSLITMAAPAYPPEGSVTLRGSCPESVVSLAAVQRENLEAHPTDPRCLPAQPPIP